ncbi:MAG: hypothetical protein DMF64_18505 [Acidobacteria bacterium]|nr:MAG: hypothetical protein DMF64_18505 [Acidobacteriota bacterium]
MLYAVMTTCLLLMLLRARWIRRGCNMRIEVDEEPLTALAEYASIPIAFEVGTVLDVADAGDGLSNFVLTERSLDVPYVKDYDALSGEHPTRWAERFDMSNWGLFAARVAGRRVGGAAVAFNTPGVDMLEGRSDLAILWDIRVAPEARGQGVGTALFRAAEAWARARSCRHFKIETQNINVPACRFYVQQGCVLAAVDHYAYPALLDEIQLLWYKALS